MAIDKDAMKVLRGALNDAGKLVNIISLYDGLFYCEESDKLTWVRTCGLNACIAVDGASDSCRGTEVAPPVRLTHLGLLWSAANTFIPVISKHSSKSCEGKSQRCLNHLLSAFFFFMIKIALEQSKSPAFNVYLLLHRLQVSLAIPASPYVPYRTKCSRAGPLTHCF